MSLMVEVITAHKEIENLDYYTYGCSCGWRAGLVDEHFTHLADELTKAGYGNVQEAKASAWDDGYALGVDDYRISLEYTSNDFGIRGGFHVNPARVNPHRKASA